MKATGGRLCGQIRYEVNSDTFIAVRCHCRDCQYVSGGEPTAAVAFPSNAVRTVKGLARVFNTYADSGDASFQSVLRRLRLSRLGLTAVKNVRDSVGLTLFRGALRLSMLTF